MATLEEEYWDDNEYGFFESLPDNDKLLYLYDLLLGGFTNEHYAGEMTDGLSELNFELEDEDGEIRQEVTVTFDDDDKRLAISGAKVEVLEKVAHDMMLNGLMLVNRETIDVADGFAIIIYKIIGSAPPISYN